MSVGIQLHADIKTGLLSRKPKPEDLFQRAEEVVKGLPVHEWAALDSESDGSQTLLVSLHPAAEPLRLSVGAGGRLTISATTSGGGPGYHEYVVEVIERLGSALNVRWVAGGGEGDDSDYLAFRDRSKLEHEMLNWLQFTLRKVDELVEDGMSVGLSMPMEVVFESEELLVTPFGPRSQDWLRRVVQDLAVGQDIFPWWGSGVGAQFHLNRALCGMWSEIRWRQPILDEAEFIRRVLADLETAYSMDPTLAYPAAEWAELAGYVGAPVPSAIASAEGSPSIGYRRRNVTVRNQGWRLTLPGSFATPPSEYFVAQDARRHVLLATIKPRSGRMDVGDFLSRHRPKDTPGLLAFEQDGVTGQAVFVGGPEPDDAFRLDSAAASQAAGALLQIRSQDADDRDWAEATWRSLAEDR